MSRLNKQCPGDCSKCELLANSEVSMVPCILDQIFQRVQKLEIGNSTMNQSILELSSSIDEIKNSMDDDNNSIYLASSPNETSNNTKSIEEEE